MAEALLDLSKFTEEDFRLLDEKAQSVMEQFGVPGVSVGIAYGDKEYTAGYGFTSIENPLPVTDETLFQIGSTTKTMTATIIMRLVEMGKVDLDAPVRQYLSDLTLKDASVAQNVTIKHLLTHTSGWSGDFFADTGWGDDALEKFTGKMGEANQITPLGELWSYNNAAFSLAGRVIETVTGKSYEAAAKELLYTPLGMNNTFFTANEAITYRVVVGHRKEEAGTEIIRTWALPRSANPAGGCITTVKDQLKYARFHMAGTGLGPDGTRLMQPETLALMQTPVTSAGGDEQIALSWFIANIGPVRVVKHGGSTFGQISAFMMAPDQDFAIVVTTNLDKGEQLNEAVTDWAFEHFLGATKAEPEHIAVPAVELAAFKGNYNAGLTSMDVDTDETGGILVATLNYHTGGLFEKDPPPIPGIKFAFYGPDKVIALEEPFKGTRGDFVRNKQGKIDWFRFGGRLAARQNS